ncbi:MAG: DUF4199 domain-containing protein [Gemmatimonadaceae bacterium]
MKRTVLTYGLIAGGILSLMMVITMPFHASIGIDRLEVIGYTSMVLAFLLIYFGVRSYRDTVSGGALSFGRAFSVGALIVLVASACYVATWEVIYFGTDSDFVASYQEHLLEGERSRGATEAELEARRAELARFAEMYRNPVINVALTFLEPLPVGLLFALVSAGLLRRKELGSGAPGGEGEPATT